MSDNVIEVQGVVKYFGGRCVLDGIDLQVPKGCIYGLLGRNGVGKTTLIRMLMGLESATRGHLSVLGADSARLPSEVKSRIGYVAEGHHLIQDYRVGRFVDLCRALSLKWDQPFFDQMTDAFRLPMERRIRDLSTGMRAQLNLALSLATDPELLILDDPTLGLDTVARRQFLELAIDLIQRQGRTILFSSHMLADVERIADRIGILLGGRLAVDCSLEELRGRIKKMRLIFADSPPPDVCLTGIISKRVEGREVTLTLANWNEQKKAMIEALRPVDCSEIQMGLEDLFLECTGTQPLMRNGQA
jgi:ABC-2 type transport system ATP-binding protein